MDKITYKKVKLAIAPVTELLTPDQIEKYKMITFMLMLRNVASSGWAFTDPTGRISKRGCIIASPSYPANNWPDTNQNYVYHWTRDAAITATEIIQSTFSYYVAFDDYLFFSELTQKYCDNYGFACFRVDGTQRNGQVAGELAWSEQSDGPALRILSIIISFGKLSDESKNIAINIVKRDLNYLLIKYQAPTRNLWEEITGLSLFARAVQLKCFQQIQTNVNLFDLPTVQKDAIQTAINWLDSRLSNDHWDSYNNRYISVLNASASDGADLNVDAIMACIYGSLHCTDPKLLSTASQIRTLFENCYSINKSDLKLGLGPLIGRYPDDHYDGNTSDGDSGTGHPWVPCTCCFAELYYRIAAEIEQKNYIVIDNLSQLFYGQVDINSATSVNDAIDKLRSAGDKMLAAIIYHSDHLELSEQFDGQTGFEKSVRNLTWSYASFLSALRARDII